jgi:hypothetical protein
MFIKASSVPVKDEYALASLCDIKKTVMELAGTSCPGKSPEEGIDLFAAKRSVVFSQNLFHLQPGTRYLSKAYSATNDQYHLILGEQGLEFFLYEDDPTNHNNVLHLFNGQVGKGGVFDPRGAFHPHFKNYFSKDTIVDIEKNFCALYKALQDWLTVKDKKVGAPPDMFDMRHSYKVRSRGYYWVKPLRISACAQKWKEGAEEYILRVLRRLLFLFPAATRPLVRRIWISICRKRND